MAKQTADQKNESLLSENKRILEVNKKLRSLNSGCKLKNKGLSDSQKLLRQENQTLIRINEDLDNFVHAASHDLLGPLGNIQASISGIRRKTNEEDLKLYLQVIDSSIKNLGKQIQSIAAIARLESEMIKSEWVTFEEILTGINAGLESEIKSSGAIIHKNFEVKQVLFSKKNLRSIIYNLISNTIKFRSTNPLVIEIGTKLLNDQVIMTIADNGKGMSASALEKIFNMHGRLIRDINGSGIGLYLAKKIINASGGKITVESEPAKGTRFTLWFK